MKLLNPKSRRFRWSYDRVICYDKDADHVWVMVNTHSTPLRYFFKSGKVCTAPCTRKVTAIRGLMRYIAAKETKE